MAWPSRRRELDPREAKWAPIKRVDEGIDRTSRIDLIDEVIETFGQQRRLPTVRTFDEALHPCPLKKVNVRFGSYYGLNSDIVSSRRRAGNGPSAALLVGKDAQPQATRFCSIGWHCIGAKRQF